MKTFSQFIAESQEVLNKMTKAWEKKHPGMTFRMKYNPETHNIHLGDIWMPPSSRGKGTGKRALKGLGRYASKIGATVSLKSSPEKGKGEELHNLYTSHGFERQGDSSSYVRKP